MVFHRKLTFSTRQVLLLRCLKSVQGLNSMIATMKPLPAPPVPGKTEFERFDNAMRRVLTVSKEELLRRETQEKEAREPKKLKRS